MGEKRVQIVITGRVQGVGFRAACQHVVVAMLARCHNGPPMVHVAAVEITVPAAAPLERSFRGRG